MRPAKCLVIKYACVRERHYTDGQRTFCIDSNTFVKEVDELCNRLEPIDWEWFWAWKQGRKSIPAESFLLTFDDVLRKQVEVVAPILETRNIGAAFFVATTPLVTGKLTSNHQVRFLLKLLEPVQLTSFILQWLDKNSPEHCWSLGTNSASPVEEEAAEKRNTELEYFLIHSLPTIIRRQMIDEIFEMVLGSSRDFAMEHCLGLNDLSDLQSKGHSIGGHSHFHEPLTEMSPEQQQRDFNRCLEVLTEGLGKSPRPYSYPFGEYEEECVLNCRESGFVQGFTSEESWTQKGTDDFLIGRVDADAAENCLIKESLLASHS